MDLIRRILLTVEADQPLNELSNVSSETLNGHIRLLMDAGFVSVTDVSSSAGEEFWVQRITWTGHEFLDAARNDSVWNTVRKTLKDKALGATVAVLQQLLTQELKRRLGLE